MADQEQKQPAKKTRPPKAKSAYTLALQKVQGEQTIQTEEQSDTQAPNHLDIEPSKQETSQPAQGEQTTQLTEQPASKPEKQQRTKATYYLNMEDIIAIDTMQTQRYRATGKKPEKSELVSQAIQLLFQQENH